MLILVYIFDATNYICIFQIKLYGSFPAHLNGSSQLPQFKYRFMYLARISGFRLSLQFRIEKTEQSFRNVLSVCK